MKKKTKWKRNCPNPDSNPNCKRELSYSRKWNRNVAERGKTLCGPCAMTGIIYSDERNKKISESHKGIKFTDERKKHISESLKGQVPWNIGISRTEETKLKIRLTTLKNRGIKYPNHNPIGCEIIRWYNMYYDFNFCHAENGGEVCIDGYFPDGLDEKRKTIIEIDESRHFNSDGKLKQKDIQRQKYLENLGYEFIRVRI